MQKTASHRIRTTPLAGHNLAREKPTSQGPEKPIISRHSPLLFIRGTESFADTPIFPAPIHPRHRPTATRGANPVNQTLKSWALETPPAETVYSRSSARPSAICYHSGGMEPYSIGVDLGGTNLRAAAVDEKGKVLERVSVPANFHAGPIHVVSEIVGAIAKVRDRLDPVLLRGVGIGVPGFIDIDTGVIIGSSNLPGFNDFPVRDEIQKHLGIPIILENDANAAALGEKWIGAGQNVKDLILLTLGTGIGGGVITDGKILHGSHGMAGEFGHMTVFPDGNPCGCGNNGCLEKHASATAIAAMGRMMHFGQEINSAEDVYNLALAGNERARWVFEYMGRALGIALASLINAFNFPLYLLTGGPLPAWDFFAPPMLAEVRKRSFTFARTATRIEKALLGGDAGLLGAAYLPFQQTMAREPVTH